MTHWSDDGVDLTLLRQDAALRASRVVARVARRIARQRVLASQRNDLRRAVLARLDRIALPSIIVAAASLAAVLTVDRVQREAPERFAIVVLGSSPATQWIVLDRRPGIPELAAMIAGTR